MEKNKITTREELKTYFKTGKYPTKSEFTELIDSLRHEEDSLTYKELVLIANSLLTMDNAYIEYSINNVGDLKFSIVISQQNKEESVIELSNTYGNQIKKFLFGNLPHIIKAKDFPTEGLNTNEYYFLYWQDENYRMQRLFGNNLLKIPDGFEFGIQEGKRSYLQLTKINFGLQIKIVNTKIRFINNTDVLIQYRTFGSYWGDIYRTEDTVTNHYNVWDDLAFYYKADLTEMEQSIECKVYDADNNQLLMTAYLQAGQNVEVSGGNSTYGIRNIRIECDYQ